MDFRSLTKISGLITVFVVLLASPIARAQDPQVAGWQRNAWRIEGLAVMIDRGPKTACSGAGIIAGYDRQRVYVLTAEHVIAGDASAGIGVTARLSQRRVPTLENPAEERRFDARVTQRDTTLDLALLEIADAGFADDVRQNSALNSLGDSSATRASDQTVIVGCGSGFGWDSPAQAVPVIAADSDSQIFFAGGYVRKGFSGGPLVKLFSSGFPQIIGLTLGVGEGQRGRAIGIDTVLGRAREWKVPIQLAAGSNDPSCSYTVTPKDVAIPLGADSFATVSVRTGPDCGWSTSSPTVNYHALLEVTVPEDRANKWGVHFGSFDVSIRRSSGCVAPRHDVEIAGRIVRVTDSACRQ